MLKNLQEIRERKGLSQARVGIEIESSQEVISAYESGKYGIGPDNLNKLANFFNCSTDYLLDRTDNPTPISMLQNKFTPQEVELMSNYKMLDKQDQDLVNGFVYGLVTKQNQNKKD